MKQTTSSISITSNEKQVQQGDSTKQGSSSRHYKRRNTYTPSLDEIVTSFDIPLEEAAQRFGISASKLKKTCRVYGIKRWQYRKFASKAKLRSQYEIVTKELNECNKKDAGNVKVEQQEEGDDDEIQRLCSIPEEHSPLSQKEGMHECDEQEDSLTLQPSSCTTEPTEVIASCSSASSSTNSWEQSPPRYSSITTLYPYLPLPLASYPQALPNLHTIDLASLVKSTLENHKRVFSVLPCTALQYSIQ